MFKHFVKFIIIFLLLCNISFAEIINSINVTGNKRISKESIVVFSEIDFTKNYNQADLNQVLKNLYNTNFFSNIKLNLNDKILDILVVENPIIQDIEIKGIKKTSFEELLIEKMSLRSRKSFNESIFLRDVDMIKFILKANGYYFSEIKTSSELNEEQNSIKLTYDIDLGKVAKIKKIRFISDKKFKDSACLPPVSNILTVSSYKQRV